MRLGPGLLATAAFVGPGTVTTCVLAGVDFGYDLLWTLALATLAAIALQEMAARLGAGARLGLAEALAQSMPARAIRLSAIALVCVAVLLGNAAYEGGNLAGAALGLEAAFARGEGELAPTFRASVILAIALLAGAGLVFGRYGFLEKALIGVVALMSAAFLGAVLLTQPAIGDVVGGLRPRLPDGSALAATALIGTTIVPYNLFLHAHAARRRWSGHDAVRDARRDAIFAIAIGGVVSASILIVTAAGAAQGAGGEGPAALARALEPAFGAPGRYLVGAGLFAAGLTSAVTAPMAAGFVAAEFFGGANEARRAAAFRIAALAVLAVGAGLGAFGARPTELIVLAQAANGVLLPIVAGFLLVLMNNRGLLGAHINGPLSNALGAGAVLLAVFFGLRGLARAIGVL